MTKKAEPEIKFTDLPESIHARIVMAQKLMKQPVIDSINTFHDNHYATLDSVLKAVLPALNMVDLALVQTVEPLSETYSEVVTRVISDNGQEYRFSIWPVPNMTDPQKFMAAVTYAKRGSILAAFARVGEPDTDFEVGQHDKHKSKPSGDFVGICESCGTSYTFKSEAQMKSVECCGNPKWRRK